MKPTAATSTHCHEIDPPILFNAWKHHAGSLRRRIAAVAGPDDLAVLAQRLIVLGGDLMDLYHGALAPEEIASRVVAQLGRDGRLELEPVRAWLEAAGAYAVVTLPDDESRWVLRLSPPPRYAHLHPGRYSPQTIRVRAPVLKTAILVLAYVRVHGGDPLDRATLNAARREFLALPPLGHDAAGHQGIASVLQLLR